MTEVLNFLKNNLSNVILGIVFAYFVIKAFLQGKQLIKARAEALKNKNALELQRIDDQLKQLEENLLKKKEEYEKSINTPDN